MREHRLIVRDPLAQVRPTAWKEGFAAYRRNKPVDDNPYEMSKFGANGLSGRRVLWFRGWYDAKHLDRWEDWLELDGSHEI